MSSTRDEILADAVSAIERDDLVAAESLLGPLVAVADLHAMTILGTALSLAEHRQADAVSILQAAANAGSGLAAHNLATLLRIVGDTNGAYGYYALADALGFEAQVASDPRWWRR